MCAGAIGCGSSSTAPSTTTAVLIGVSLSPNSVSAGTSLTGTVTLSAAAPTGGAAVTLTSSNGAAVVPATVTIGAGSTNQTFEVDTVASSSSNSVTISASYGGNTLTATLTVGRLVLQSIALSAGSVVSGSPVTGTLTLTGPAAGDAPIAIASSNPAVVVPASVTIPSGSTTQNFEIDTVDSPSLPAIVTITASYAGAVRTTTLAVGHLALQSLSLSIGSVPGGLPVTGLVTLTVDAPAGGVTVALASSSPDAQVPSSVTVPAGQATQTFQINTIDAPPTTTATVTGTYAGAVQTATLTVFAYAGISGVSCSPSNPTSGAAVQCTITFTTPAPAGGWRLALSSSDPSTVVPAIVAVAPGSSTVQFPVSIGTVSTPVSAAISIADAPTGLLLFTQVLNITPS